MTNEPTPAEGKDSAQLEAESALRGAACSVSIEDYQKRTLEMIRDKGSRLNDLSQDGIKELYRQWSKSTMSAGWLMHTENGINSFIQWATTAPCDFSQNAERIHGGAGLTNQPETPTPLDGASCSSSS